MKANGSWPLSASAIPTTQHSATFGLLEMACSMEPTQLVLELDASALQGGAGM